MKTTQLLITTTAHGTTYRQTQKGRHTQRSLQDNRALRMRYCTNTYNWRVSGAPVRPCAYPLDVVDWAPDPHCQLAQRRCMRMWSGANTVSMHAHQFRNMRLQHKRLQCTNSLCVHINTSLLTFACLNQDQISIPPAAPNPLFTNHTQANECQGPPWYCKCDTLCTCETTGVIKHNARCNQRVCVCVCALTGASPANRTQASVGRTQRSVGLTGALSWHLFAAQHQATHAKRVVKKHLSHASCTATSLYAAIRFSLNQALPHHTLSRV